MQILEEVLFWLKVQYKGLKLMENLFYKYF
jgi:hypothetical protein